MKISNSLNNSVTFEKTLTAKCGVLKNGSKSESCKIYKLDSRKDIGYFSRLKNSDEWQNNHFVRYMENEIISSLQNENKDVFVMEENNGNCISFMETVKHNDYLSLELIETAPAHTDKKKNPASGLKYIGETFITFCTKIAEADKLNKILLEPLGDSYEFYTDNCFFIENYDMEALELNKNKFNDLEKRNKNHTGAEIEMINC